MGSSDQQINFSLAPASNSLPLGISLTDLGTDEAEISGTYGEYDDVVTTTTPFDFIIRAQEVANPSDFIDRSFRITISNDPGYISPS